MAKRHVVDFRTPNTIDEIAVALGVSRELLDRVVDAASSSEARDQLYVQHRIPKKRPKNGNFRVVWAPFHNELREAHRAFARRFDDFLRDSVPGFPHSAAYGYVRGRGTRQNATQHCGKRRLLRADIEQFFTSISRSRLVGRFLQIGIQREAADVMSALATINGSLAMGLNASPTLANLVCTALDQKMAQLASDFGCVYTRYADDIAISGDNVPSRLDVASIVESEGFQLAPGKFRVTTIGQAHFVTGLSVSDPKAPHVPRNFKRQLRQELFYCQKYGIAEHLNKVGEGTYQRGVNRIDGSIKYLASIESAIGEGLRKQWRDILAKEKARLSYAPRHDLDGVDTAIFVDETEIDRDGQRLLALICVTTEQPAYLSMAVTQLLRQYQADPFSSGRKGKLATKGLHFSDAPEDLRTSFITSLPFLPFRGYLAFGKLNGSDYAELYLTLLARLMPRRLRALDRGRVQLVLEQNSKVKRSAIEQQVNSTYCDLEARNERRPIAAPTVAIGAKQDCPELAVPDFLLGVFSQYFGDSANQSAIARLRFERLRDKYRHIIDVDSGKEFSRRHPLEV